MSTHGSDDRSQLTGSLSRRAALVRGGAAGAAAAAIGALGFGQRVLAQDATPVATAPAGWRSHRLEVSFTPHDPVSITVAGSGPPQRGDHFYIDAPIFAMGDEGGAQIGVYQCFGAWTAAADDTTAENQRLTTVRFQLPDGLIMGLINEFGTDPSAHLGAVQGGTGAYFGAIGTFTQVFRESTLPGATEATPAAAVTVVDSTFDLLLPGGA